MANNAPLDSGGNVPRKQRTIADVSFVESLDIKDLLDDPCGEPLSSLVPILPSISDDSLSFNDVPPFPSQARPPLFINVVKLPVLKRRPNTPKALITVQTGPRLKLMLMEPLCAREWMSKLDSKPAPGHLPWKDYSYQEDDVFAPPVLEWIPEGSQFSPEEFKSRLEELHPERPRTQSSVACSYQSPLSPTDPKMRTKMSTHKMDHKCNTEPQAIKVVDSDGLEVQGDTPDVLVPTILVSSSTAIIPLSLESSQSLARAPLAIRRGQKVPTPLSLNKANDRAAEAGPYPNIPTPFLGSPSSSSPTFEFSDYSTAVSMDAEAMCADLRKRCPDLRSVAPETPDQPVADLRAATSEHIVADHENEWDFAQELLDHYGSGVPALLDADSPQTPSLGRVQDSDAEHSGADMDSFSWAMSTTLTNSPEPSVANAIPPEIRQMRRKTVIVERPLSQAKLLDPNSSLQTSLQGLEEHCPVPLESPSRSSFSCAQCQQSTPAQSRPTSSASMRPAKGILKEKKCVRFSIVPSRHEYPLEEPSSRETSTLSATEPAKRSAMSKRHTSPLSKSFSSSDGGSLPNSPTSAKTDGPASLPKHPALRAMARPASRPVSPQTPTPTVTPAILADQQRAPLQSLNTRQSLPAKRSSNAVYADQKRRGITTADVGKPRRLMKAASTSSPGCSHDADAENDGVRREPAVPKSRMPVPFRTILTRLRA